MSTANNTVEPTQTLRIGEALVYSRKMTQDQLDLCVLAQTGLHDWQPDREFKIGDLVVNYGFVSRLIVDVVSTRIGEKSSGLGMLTSLPQRILQEVRAYPLSLHNGILTMAAAGHVSEADKDKLISAANGLGVTVNEIVIESYDSAEVLGKINKQSAPDRATISAEINELVYRTDEPMFITQVIEHIYMDAIQARASDIHLMVVKDKYVAMEQASSWIFYRIDGQRKAIYFVPAAAMRTIVARMKMDAEIDHTNDLKAHDGRMTIDYQGARIDIRASSLPNHYGEKVVMRILDANNIPDISDLFELHPEISKEIAQTIALPPKSPGIVLVTGPTGSGKSTTLNSWIRGMDRVVKAVHTVEDPVETIIPLVSHTSVNEAAGMSYAKVLKAMLRQDIDVIMVGEMRDAETVETALHATDTGHLLFSTLHTGSVAESVTRLLGMIPDVTRNLGKFIIANSLRGVLNQKLEKRICQKCATAMDAESIDPTILNMVKKAMGENPLPDSYMVAKGCEHCGFTGYRGRVVLPEALFIDSGHVTRSEVLQILLEGRAFNEAFQLDGVMWYPRSKAAASLLRAHVMDIPTALAALDVYHGI